MSFGGVFNAFGNCKAYLATKYLRKSYQNPLVHFYLPKYLSFQGSARGLLPWVREQTTFSDTRSPRSLVLVSHTHQFGPGVRTDCESQSSCSGYFKMTFQFPT